MPVIIFFHGNGETAADGQEPMGLFAARGYGVVLAEFRGFGGSTGTPSEAGIIGDGRTEIAWAARRWPGARQVLWGESIGTGVAVALAGETGPLAVVLDSPFTSIREVAVRKFPFLLVPLLLRHPFDSMARTGGVEAPVIVLTGNSDRVVPPDMGHAVLTALITSRPCRLAQGIFLDGGHMVERNDGTGRWTGPCSPFLAACGPMARIPAPRREAATDIRLRKDYRAGLVVAIQRVLGKSRRTWQSSAPAGAGALAWGVGGGGLCGRRNSPVARQALVPPVQRRPR